MFFYKNLVGLNQGSWTFDPSTPSAATITFTSDIEVTEINLFHIKNLTTGEKYYEYDDVETYLTSVSGNVVTLDISSFGGTPASDDNFKIFIGVDDTTRDADIAAQRSVQLNQENEIYQDPIELVSASDIGTTDDTYDWQGSRIDCRGYNELKLDIQFTLNNSSGAVLEFVEFRTDDETGDTVAFVSDDTNDYQVSLDSFDGVPIWKKYNVTSVSFIQIRTKATDVDDGGGTIGTITIDYSLSNF